ncbi:UNVERIFIED_CONTAM: hypothetical protein GTU68_030356 [Idotea baltica]|nr:hypothetical protein [Idotea baltica]
MCVHVCILVKILKIIRLSNLLQEPPKYEFDWLVKDEYSGNDFGQQESRDGYDTKGSYYVLLPDGRRQTVTYYVNGDSGFIADVAYEQTSYQPKPQPSYKPKPQPSYEPKPQPSYQPKPQPSYQPKPQPSYQPKPQYGF